ncbi:aspartate/glutamate racemase family protein [Paralcaligenes sp. KSB-10]|uniref:aspartate/glutamate racemase family protein n=1 Tax=Paralcaligenes sp. KSB-10 TaxID=2901142 RepID=UPI001E5B8255|nr:aspartate/glutamate racemase family protein [Paralcaligenes sp. KSB-10]UHL65648.1 aspartate/glutamate racemase family protein [Paralcaligenes sp. KSB-10]
MSIKIWYQSMAPLGGLPCYVEALQRHASQTCGDEVAVTFNGASESWYGQRTPAEMLKFPYVKHIIQREAIDFCRKAESEGYDAVILGSFSEPFLAEIRSLLDIPVVSMPESALLVACSLAEQFALVPLAPAGVRRVRALVRRHGLEGRVCGIEALSAPVTEAQLEAAFDAPQEVIEDFETVARRLVEAGADLVIPAEGVISELLYWNGVRRIDEAAVMDCIGTSLAYACMLVRLKRTSGLGVGRRWGYCRPPDEILQALGASR